MSLLPYSLQKIVRLFNDWWLVLLNKLSPSAYKRIP